MHKNIEQEKTQLTPTQTSTVTAHLSKWSTNGVNSTVEEYELTIAA